MLLTARREGECRHSAASISLLSQEAVSEEQTQCQAVDKYPGSHLGASLTPWDGWIHAGTG